MLYNIQKLSIHSYSVTKQCYSVTKTKYGVLSVSLGKTMLKDGGEYWKGQCWLEAFITVIIVNPDQCLENITFTHHAASGAENISVILVQNYFNILHCCACFPNYLMFSVSVYVYFVLVHCSWRRSYWVCRRSWKEWRMSWTNTPSRWRMPRRSWSKRRKRLQMWVEGADVRGLHRDHINRWSSSCHIWSLKHWYCVFHHICYPKTFNISLRKLSFRWCQK